MNYLNQEIVRKLKKYKPEKIILFGSHAWGKPRASSDIDILIIKKSKLPKRFRTTRAEKFLSKLPYPVDVIVYTPKELKERTKMGDFFIKLIFKKGQVLYEKK